MKVLSFLGLLLFVSMYLIISNDPLPYFDKKTAEILFQYHSTFFDQLFIIVTYLNNVESVLIISIIVSIYLINKKRFKALLFYLFTIVTATISTYFFKIYIMRNRPDNGLLDINSYAFPSWHATLSVVLSLLVFIIFNEYIKNSRVKKFFISFIFIWPLLIGFSRVYLNVHWLSDVLAGWGLGLFIVSTSTLFFKYFNENSTIKF
ncbi:phosphatase PAP2 family protein [Hydrogenimonas thermophila]|uniref:Undecaprenyl-diphosphatase n=1 Tax=Hydrogenimonas thermophila TaxID=223786 RepID=A0A1I5NAD6_9BACT|nr:phosphatase PAP2 family protein [Hydrogenimonas thermophila]SFP18296.1 undecaprenyl-diphosphatase [Hydrogenimonas thermophila]